MLTRKIDNFMFGTKGIPYIFWGNNWEGRSVYHPQIIKKEGKYHMIYSGVRSIKRICFRHDIGMAVSNDFQDWSRFKKNPIFSPTEKNEWDSDLVAHSYIIEKDGIYYMFYDGSPKGFWHEEIGLATSKDLINWKRYEHNPVLKAGHSWWDKNHVSRCCIFLNEGKYYMFFAGHDGYCERIGLAVSVNLLNWERAGDEPVLGLGKKDEWDEVHISDPRIVKINDIFLMFYSGYGIKGQRGGVGVAFSKDLMNWQRFEKNPILEVGSSREWDCDEACRADIFKEKEQYYLIYSGRKGLRFRIGLAYLDMKQLVSEILIQINKK